MLFDDYLSCIEDPDAPHPDISLIVGADDNGLCVVNGLVPMPLVRVSSALPRCDSTIVHDENGDILGEVLTCKGESFSIPAFSAGYLAAYLQETPSADYGKGGTFHRDYFLVRSSRLGQYLSDYKDSSGIWGGFQHVDVPTVVQPAVVLGSIRAIGGINLTSDIQLETIARSIDQPFAFERYLKLYHLLELRFDQEVVQNIQSLGKDLKGIGRILSSYNSKELVRLNQVIGKCRQPSVVVSCVQAITADSKWHGSIRDIFFQFGKEGNPLVDKEAEFMDLLTSTGYSLLSVQPIAGRIPKSNHNSIQERKFELFTLELAAYWIYRVRSSIAHSRIGEYVMRVEDEDFVANFAEVLLRSVLGQTL